MTVHARLSDPERLPSLLESCRKAGVSTDALEIRSSAPLPEHLLPGVSNHSRALPAAILGALTGGTTAYLVASLTAKAYPMITGGMKIVALPPVGIVTYEGTALGLILATVGLVLIEAKVLFRKAPRTPFAQNLAAGDIVLALDAGEDEVDRVRRALFEAGADEVR